MAKRNGHVELLEAKEHHFIEPRNIVLSGNEKIDRAMLRLERKRIRTEKEERALLAAVDVTREVTGGIVKGAFDTLSKGLEAVGQIGRGVADNPDPIAQGVALAGAAASLFWLAYILEGNPYTKPVGDFLQLDKLLAGLTGLTDAGQKALAAIADAAKGAATQVIDNVQKGNPIGTFRAGDGKYCFTIGVTKPTGLFGLPLIFGILPDPLGLASKFGSQACYTDRGARDAALKALTDSLGIFGAFYTFTTTDQDPVGGYVSPRGR